MKGAKKLLPRNKHDFESVHMLKVLELKTLDKKELEVIIPELLKWLQDINWPISGEITKLLLTVPEESLPYVLEVLNGQDDVWKAWCLRYFVLELSIEFMKGLEGVIRRMVFEPTEGELIEEVHLTALEIWEKLQIHGRL